MQNVNSTKELINVQAINIAEDDDFTTYGVPAPSQNTGR